MKIKLNNGIEAEITLNTRVYHGVWCHPGKILALKHSSNTKNFRKAVTHSLSHNLKYYVDIYNDHYDRFIEFHRTKNECVKRLNYIRTLIESCK